MNAGSTIVKDLLKIKSQYCKAQNRVYRGETNKQKLYLIQDIKNKFYEHFHKDSHLLNKFLDEYNLVLGYYIHSQPGMSNFTIDIGLGNIAVIVSHR